MQCTSQYPCEDKMVGINVFDDFKKIFKNCILGFSDHTQENIAAILAVSKGAKYFEKHLTFSKKCMEAMRSLHQNLLNLKNIVKLLKAEVIIRNKVNKNDLRPFRQMRAVFQKSIVYKYSLKKGQKINMSMLSFVKPDKGISANKFQLIIGKKLKKMLKK